MNHIEPAFWEFHAENPEVYDLFDQYAQMIVTAGRKRYGVKSIAERIRWHRNIEARGQTFKINNNFPAYYARLWMKRNPQHGRVFELRVLHAGEVSEALRLPGETPAHS
mgnify:CR=1 FL=1